MQIKVTGHGVEITDPLRDYVHEKIGKLEQYFSNIQKVEVILDARSIDDRNKRQVAEIRAWMAGLREVQASEAGQDMYAAIDLAFSEAKRQIEKHKEKHVQEQRRKASAFKQRRTEFPLAEESAGPVLVRVSRFARKPMNFQEACEELKSTPQDFLAFRNTESDEVNVVYKNGEAFGLLRPEENLNPDEALKKVTGSALNFLLFNNSQTNLPTVIFRRKSGNFGLIEPEY